MGEANFAGQYQQRPQAAGGGLVKAAWFRRYGEAERPGRFDAVIQSWDTANTAGELADYSVCTTWGLRRDSISLLDVFRRRLAFPDLFRAVVARERAHRPATILIEDRASGTQLIQDLIASGVADVKAAAPGGDKVMRLHAQTARIENGFVLLPREAALARRLSRRDAWLFPAGRHDDQVDFDRAGAGLPEPPARAGLSRALAADGRGALAFPRSRPGRFSAMLGALLCSVSGSNAEGRAGDEMEAAQVKLSIVLAGVLALASCRRRIGAIAGQELAERDRRAAGAVAGDERKRRAFAAKHARPERPALVGDPGSDDAKPFGAGEAGVAAAAAFALGDRSTTAARLEPLVARLPDAADGAANAPTSTSRRRWAAEAPTAAATRRWAASTAADRDFT